MTIKNIFIILAGLFFSAKIVAQQPVFLSPYKSGKPVPESSKDYAKPVPMSLLDGGNKKQFVASKSVRLIEEAEQKNVRDNKNKPLMQNSGKKDSQTK